MRQQWTLGRVIAIHAVATYSEAEKWQKEAFHELIWMWTYSNAMSTATRNSLARNWFKLRAIMYGAWVRAGSPPVLEITP